MLHFQEVVDSNIKSQEAQEGPLQSEIDELEGDVRRVNQELEKEGARKEAFSLSLVHNRKLLA